MAARVTVLSRFLPEPVKAQEFLTKFSVNLMRDPALLQGMETIVRPDISCKECADTTVGSLEVLCWEIFCYSTNGHTYIERKHQRLKLCSFGRTRIDYQLHQQKKVSDKFHSKTTGKSIVLKQLIGPICVFAKMTTVI
jgi:hypothetical protein